MRILRAHSYDAVERIRAELNRVPEHWQRAADPWRWIVLPDDLKPSWIGLTLRTDAELLASKDEAINGRGWDEIGAWTASEEHAYWVRDTPHIFTTEGDVARSAVHEIAHALSRAWNVDEADFYKPDEAWDWYMTTTPEEFWACALDAYLRQDSDDKRWNRLDVAKRVPDLHDYLQAKRRA